MGQRKAASRTIIYTLVSISLSYEEQRLTQSVGLAAGWANFSVCSFWVDYYWFCICPLVLNFLQFSLHFGLVLAS